MSLLTGRHTTTVGVTAMDDQHGILMDTLNELRLTVVRGMGREQVNEVLDRLIEFTRMQHGEKMQMRPLLCFLRESFTEHMEGTDCEYGSWMNQHGVE